MTKGDVFHKIIDSGHDGIFGINTSNGRILVVTEDLNMQIYEKNRDVDEVAYKRSHSPLKKRTSIREWNLCSPLGLNYDSSDNELTLKSMASISP